MAALVRSVRAELVALYSNFPDASFFVDFLSWRWSRATAATVVAVYSVHYFINFVAGSLVKAAVYAFWLCFVLRRLRLIGPTRWEEAVEGFRAPLVRGVAAVAGFVGAGDRAFTLKVLVLLHYGEMVVLALTPKRAAAVCAIMFAYGCARERCDRLGAAVWRGYVHPGAQWTLRKLQQRGRTPRKAAKSD
eukprot:TRINITY_DN47424_c0_g1_i1.p1 TRINITY_DN47424_c0_g1~~TRINITY_DN47424_c0_g1_i1.p1  ORF type:complete len:210 (+),score=68.68 TRINITY_DN47424_c0_g1_i1:61-630(+)